MQRWYVSAYNSPHAGSIHFSSGLQIRWKLTILSLVNYQDYIGILFSKIVLTYLLYEKIVLVIEKNVCKFDAVGQEFAIFIQTLNGQNIFLK